MNKSYAIYSLNICSYTNISLYYERLAIERDLVNYEWNIFTIEIRLYIVVNKYK